MGEYKKAVFLHSAETWSLTKGLKQKLQVFINRCLRSILVVWWPKRIRIQLKSSGDRQDSDR